MSPEATRYTKINYLEIGATKITISLRQAKVVWLDISMYDTCSMTIHNTLDHIHTHLAGGLDVEFLLFNLKLVV